MIAHNFSRIVKEGKKEEETSNRMLRSQGTASRAVNIKKPASDKENLNPKPSRSGHNRPRCVLGDINIDVKKKNSSNKENLPPVETKIKSSAEPKIKNSNISAYIPPQQKPIQVPVQTTVRAKKTKTFVASLCFDVPAEDCHPVALAFRSDYKKKKEELAKYLFEYFNDEIFGGKLPYNTTIEWAPKFLKRSGVCHYEYLVHKKTRVYVKTAKIRLSSKLLDTAYKLQGTLVHEMCHAAVWIIDDVRIESKKDSHGAPWRKWTDLAMKRFPELPPITQYHSYKMKTKFTYKCLACGHCIGRHSKSLDITTKRCDRCNGQLELLLNRTTRSGRLRSPIPVKEKPLTGFALFVRENFRKVSEDRRDIKPTEAMKLLAEQFSNLRTGE